MRQQKPLRGMIPMRQQRAPTTKDIVRMIEQKNKQFKDKHTFKLHFLPMKARLVTQGQDFEEIFADIKYTYKMELAQIKNKEKARNMQYSANESFLVNTTANNKNQTKVRFKTQSASYRSQGKSPKGKLIFQKKQKNLQHFSFRNKTQYVGSSHQQKKQNQMNKNQIKCKQNQRQKFLHASLQSDQSSKGSQFSLIHSLRKLNHQEQNDRFLPVKAKYILMKFNSHRSRIKTQTSLMQNINGQMVTSKKIILDKKWNDTPSLREKSTPIAPW